MPHCPTSFFPPLNCNWRHQKPLMKCTLQWGLCLWCMFCMCLCEHSMNRLSSLPRGFGSLPALEVLDLTYNNLNQSSLPGNFFYLSKFALTHACKCLETDRHTHKSKHTQIHTHLPLSCVYHRIKDKLLVHNLLLWWLQLLQPLLPLAVPVGQSELLVLHSV